MKKLLILHFCCVLESCSPAMLFIISLLLLWYEGAGPQSEPLSTPGREHELMTSIILLYNLLGVFFATANMRENIKTLKIIW